MKDALELVSSSGSLRHSSVNHPPLRKFLFLSEVGEESGLISETPEILFYEVFEPTVVGLRESEPTVVGLRDRASRSNSGLKAGFVIYS